jgi:hypothetical protein
MLLQPRSGSNVSGALLLGIAVASFLMLIALDRGRTFNYAGQPAFWDAHVYAHAIRAIETGGDPYARETPLMYVYPPVFLYGARALRYLIHGELAWKLYLLLNLSAVIAIPVVIATRYLRSHWLNAGCALLISTFHPFFTSAFSFFSGNLANVLYALVLLAGVPGVRKNRWACFYVTLVGAAAIKIPMLAFLLLPLLVGEGQVVPSLFTGLTVLILNGAQRVLILGAYHGYLDAARFQLLVRNDVGLGLFATLFRLVHRSAHLPQSLPYAAHVVFFASLAAGLCWAHKRGVPASMRNWWISLVLLLSVLCNPRVLAYDIALIIVPLAFLTVEMLGACLARKLPPMLLAGCVVAAIIALARSPLNFYYFFSIACFPIAAYLRFTSSNPAHDIALETAETTSETWERPRGVPTLPAKPPLGQAVPHLVRQCVNCFAGCFPTRRLLRRDHRNATP